MRVCTTCSWLPALGGVRRVAVPPSVRRHSTLRRVDYEDAFLVETGPTHLRTAEEWARAILEDAPAVVRSALTAGWSTLGLRLDPDATDSVLGWRVRHSTPDILLLGAGSRLGLPAELLLERRRRTLVFATFVCHENPIARTIWVGVIPLHQQVVRYVLGLAAPASDDHSRHPGVPRSDRTAEGPEAGASTR